MLLSLPRGVEEGVHSILTPYFFRRIERKRNSTIHGLAGIVRVVRIIQLNRAILQPHPSAVLLVDRWWSLRFMLPS